MPLHALALSLLILLLVLISQKVMSGQVKLYLPYLMCILWVILDILLNVVWWIGAKSFNRRSLHHIGDGLNPYEQAISIIGKTLAAFDEDNLIPCFGFGDGMFMKTCLAIRVWLRKMWGNKCDFLCWQHLHMIRMFSASIQMKDSVMDLKKFWVVTEKLCPIFDLQVYISIVRDFFLFFFKIFFITSINWCC